MLAVSQNICQKTQHNVNLKFLLVPHEATMQETWMESHALSHVGLVAVVEKETGSVSFDCIGTTY